MFATNCWIIADAPGGECIIVDPGMPDVSDTVAMVLNEHKLKAVATIITHGHLDHTFSIVPVADGYGIPTYIHSEDRALLLHPERAHGAEFLPSLLHHGAFPSFAVQHLFGHLP
jgi:glyoxylase-like metal-dependent hydrolase (beta-lactamase superfamily II)